MKAEEINKEFTESERLSTDEQEIAQMLGVLRRVEAPGDFEFRVRARIAKAVPAEAARSPLAARLKLLAPLALALMVAGFIGFNELMPRRVDNETTVAEAPQAESPLPSSQPNLAAIDEAPEAPAPATVTERSREEVAFTTRNLTSKRRRAMQIVDDNSGGSKTLTGRGAKVLINPKGIDPTPLNSGQKPSALESTARTGARELLSVLGIDAEPASNGWRVRSSKANSAAERAGLKPGDVIEAVGDRQIDANSVFTGNFGVKSLKILRDGKSLIIALKNK